MNNKYFLIFVIMSIIYSNLSDNLISSSEIQLDFNPSFSQDSLNMEYRTKGSKNKPKTDMLSKPNIKPGNKINKPKIKKDKSSNNSY